MRPHLDPSRRPRPRSRKPGAARINAGSGVRVIDQRDTHARQRRNHTPPDRAFKRSECIARGARETQRSHHPVTAILHRDRDRRKVVTCSVSSPHVAQIRRYQTGVFLDRHSHQRSRARRHENDVRRISQHVCGGPKLHPHRGPFCDRGLQGVCVTSGVSDGRDRRSRISQRHADDDGLPGRHDYCGCRKRRASAAVRCCRTCDCRDRHRPNPTAAQEP